MLELDRSNFKQTVKRDAIVLIECWAPGCGACLALDPIFAKVAETYRSHTFARMNVATEEKLGEFFEIDHTPSLMLYRDGLLLLKKPGNFSEDALCEIVRQAESLDMAVVRADIESSETEKTTERKNND
ncbi:MAG: protein disulfide isomerase family protein [Myxococcota bacterium]|nr:protein disulfide isomerase family protein [Myxococcota bacterium]